MTTVRRLTLVSTVLGLTALLTSAHVWGEAGKTKNPKAPAFNGPPAVKAERLADDLAATKFSKKPVVTYQTQDGATLFGLQVKPQLDGPARPRDVLILVDTSASQVRGPLVTARMIAEKVAAVAGPKDRVALMTVNIPAATKMLTRGFKAPGDAAIQDAVEKLKQEVPFGATDLKTALEQAMKAFEHKEGRQQAIVFLGNGMSIHNPIDNKQRSELCEELVAKQIALFPVPLGPQTQLERGSANLHGFATGTGGVVVRHLEGADVADTAQSINNALAAPIFYTTKFDKPAEATEIFPAKLPPLRSDVPTLVIGTMKSAKTLTYTVEGRIAGKSVAFRVTENVPVAEFDNFFLGSILEQWRKADRDSPALLRADRALALAFEQNRIVRDELVAQANWALEFDNLGAAHELFARAHKIDPNDAEADAGMKIVEKLRAGLLTKKQLREALAKRGEKTVKGEKVEFARDLLAQADAKEEKQPAAAPGAGGAEAPPAGRDDFLRQEKARLAVEEQRIIGVVGDAERQARRLLPTDPDAAHDLLKRTLDGIRNNPDLTNATRGNLLSRLDTALRNVDTQGARIKQDLDQRLRDLADAQRRFALEEARVRGEELIRRKVQGFNDLMNQGRFELAYAEAVDMQREQLERGEPIPPVMPAASTMSSFANNSAKSQELKRQAEQNTLLTWFEVDKSHIPFPDEPPVRFPPKKTWEKLTERRKGVYDYSGLGEDDPKGIASANRIKDVLSKPIDFPDGIPQNTSIKDAIDTIYDKLKVRQTPLTFVTDKEAFKGIEVANVDEQTVSLQPMVGVSLSTVLRLLLGQIKGNRYTGTYIVRRDYVEITTTFVAAAEKISRAYPVADLVIPIPNAVNQQALQQSLQVYGQFQQANAIPLAAAPFAGGLGGFGFGGGFGGAFGGGGFGAGGLGAGGIPGVNPFAFNPGGQPGMNQFGNFGGQFGFQGPDKSFELMQLITKVVAPGEWAALGTNPNQPPAPPGFGGPLAPAPAAAPDPTDSPTVDRPLLNSLDYYQPARALVVRGSSRIHTRIGGGLVGANPMGGPPPMQGNAGKKIDGAIVGKPNEKDPKVAVAGDGGQRTKPKMGPPKPALEFADFDFRKAWEDALAKTLEAPKADHAGLVIACADFLVQHGKYDQAAEFLKAELRLGIVTRPWVYEALSLALQLSGGSAEEIERAQVSAIDIEPTDAQGYLRAAKAMVELKRTDRAVALCRQAALMQPNGADAYADALAYAEASKDSDSMAWAAGNLLRRDWPTDNDFLHNQARQSLTSLARTLATSRKADAERMLNAVNEVKVRDLVITLSWQCELGDADLDLKVKEPIGTVCSFLQRQTSGGGTLLGDGVNDGSREVYVAAEAFSGEYQVTIDKVRGRPLGNKATVEVVKFQGTPRQTSERYTVSFDKDGKTQFKVNLSEGRRTTVAIVPPVTPRSERVANDTASGDRVLNKLRALTEPVYDGGMQGGVNATGGRLRAEMKPLTSRQVEKLDLQTKVQGAIGNGVEMMTQPVIDPKTGRAGVKLNPVFQTLGKPDAAPVANPLIPGGF
jgi:hypothetical protein